MRHRWNCGIAEFSRNGLSRIDNHAELPALQVHEEKATL
jgi:hypothetical protein